MSKCRIHNDDGCKNSLELLLDNTSFNNIKGAITEYEHDKHPKVYAYIGLVNNNFVLLESTVDKTIRRLLRITDDELDVILGKQGFATKFDILKKLMIQENYRQFMTTLIAGHEEEHIDRIIGAIAECNNLRNRAIHNIIDTDPFDDLTPNNRNSELAETERYYSSLCSYIDIVNHELGDLFYKAEE